MSLVARHLETNGIPTVIIGSALDVVEHCGVPRFLFTDFPLGNPCGHPWDREMQEAIVRQGIGLLASAKRPRTTVRSPFSWKSHDPRWRVRYGRVDPAERERLLAAGEERRRQKAKAKAAKEGSPVLQDRYGNDLTTNSTAARDAYVVGLDRLLSADAGIENAFRDAIAADPNFALAHIALARTLQVLGRGGELKAPLERALALVPNTTEREQSQIAIFAKILSGQGGAAVPMILEHMTKWPRDAMALAPITGVFGLIGFSGKSGREAEQLAVLQPYASAYGDDWWYRTVLAFAEIEMHDFNNGLRNIETALRGKSA